MSEERKNELIGIIDSVADSYIKYNVFAEEKFRNEHGVCFFRERSIFITEGFMEIAEALGITPDLEDTSVYDGTIFERYHFKYRGLVFYTTIGVMEMKKVKEIIANETENATDYHG